ncbi:MAG: protein-glutamate O-methyltransferase CheR [Magnetococcales bacterium]|nr:protein-glutamate O-methyltransferase CheR [Magnetococcales bacterium]
MAISNKEFKLISEFLKEHSGIIIKPGKEYLVENRLTIMLVQNGCDNYLQFYQKLQKDSALRTKFVDALTTNETLWFRDNTFFDGLEDHIIPQLLEKSKNQSKIRIWSAASSTGQEIYSVGMLLDHVARKKGIRFEPRKFELVGTDLSTSALQIAKLARYNQMAISRGMRKDFLTRYFVKSKLAYEVAPNIKNLVSFKQFNLKNSFISMGKFDLILCRNVLIYFSDDFKKDIYSKLRTALSRDGYLAIGGSETPRGLTTSFKQFKAGRSVLYQAGP